MYELSIISEKKPFLEIHTYKTHTTTMKIENQNASEVPIVFKFSINSKKQKTKQKTQETKMKC